MADYRIVGADQKEYGPVTEEQLRQWIAEGRANGQTMVKLDDGPWKALSTFPEFASILETSAPPPPSAPPPSTIPPLSAGAPAVSSSAPTSGLAIAGLVCSILGLSCGFVPCCVPVFSTVGLILSAAALSQINQNPVKYSGRGVAIAGIIIALIGYVLFAIFAATGVLTRSFRGFPRHFRHLV